jgi:hypothetical protein
VLFLDSAGAKVSEGLRALGAFRQVYREALAAALSGAPIAAVLGRNCYGGSSMLAHLAQRRLFGPSTQLAMSGPSILAASAGMDVLDEMFRAMAQASISAASRARASPANRVWSEELSVAGWLRAALAPAPKPAEAFLARHEALGERLGKDRPAAAKEEVRRRDLERLYPGGYAAHETAGSSREQVDRSTARKRCSASSARRRSARSAHGGLRMPGERSSRRRRRGCGCCWTVPRTPPRLDDERVVLSEYVVDMSMPLALLAARALGSSRPWWGRRGWRLRRAGESCRPRECRPRAQHPRTARQRHHGNLGRGQGESPSAMEYGRPAWRKKN